MARIIFELGVNLIETLIIVDFLTRYLGIKYRDRRGVIGFFGAWLAFFVEVSITNHFVSFEGVGSLIHLAVFFIYALLFLKGSILLKLWICALIEIINMIIGLGTALIACSIMKCDPNDIFTVFNSTRIIAVIITKVILFYTCKIILRYKYRNPLDNQSWIMLILIPIISVISLSALMFAAMAYEEISGYILCGMSGILLANIITYYFFTRLNKDYETKLRIKLLEQDNENARKNIENADAFVRQMKSAEHDMKNQLLIIYNYIDSGKYTDAKDYIQSLTNDYLPEVQNFISSSNDAFSAIVNSKIVICNRKRIYIEIKEKKDALKTLNAVDTGILFGNLLDNAIEAAKKTDNRRITVDVQTNGNYLSILVTNSIDKSVLSDNEKLETSKQNKELHGIGIKSIKAVVKKYDGMIQFFEESGEFCCHILLDIDN